MKRGERKRYKHIEGENKELEKKTPADLYENID
jgi:hypothetical protein